MLQFRLLGPLEVARGGESVPLGGRRQRAVLAVLLLHSNRRISRVRLIDEVWNGRPPTASSQTLQSYLSRLRQVLGDAVPISSQADGYLLSVDPTSLDFERFRSLVGDGHRAVSEADYERAGVILHEALGLWRGDPLSDLDGEEFVRAPIAEWSELQLMALCDRIRADVECGLAETVIGELEALIVRYPDRERFRELLMRALYLAGRQSDALACYRRGRQAMNDQYGIEPWQPLRDLERAILLHDPSLSPATPGLRRSEVRRPEARDVAPRTSQSECGPSRWRPRRSRPSGHPPSGAGSRLHECSGAGMASGMSARWRPRRDLLACKAEVRLRPPSHESRDSAMSF